MFRYSDLRAPLKGINFDRIEGRRSLPDVRKHRSLRYPKPPTFTIQAAERQSTDIRSSFLVEAPSTIFFVFVFNNGNM